MEDGSDGLPSDPPLPEPMQNGELMARLQDGRQPDDKDSVSIKVNGSVVLDETRSDESDSSDYDALVIDESATSKNDHRKPKPGFKGFKNTASNELDTYMHSNPYFAESIFELFEKSQEKKRETKAPEEKKAPPCKNHRKVKSNPKLREYAQYLGLQPTVQFKCSKCSRAGFPSLASLNYHILRCTDTPPVNGASDTTSAGTSTNFRITRKVFLCSACGTYYENWNLFLHMREVHKRYICLYCLGMFSHPEKLSLHIVSKHNCIPSRINTLEEFFDAHKEPCFLMCCECQRGFTETDNFFEHQCIDGAAARKPVKQNSNPKERGKNTEHVTADSNGRTRLADLRHDNQANNDGGNNSQEGACDDDLERAPSPETLETPRQVDSITCDSNLTQTTDSQAAIFADDEDDDGGDEVAGSMRDEGAVSVSRSDEDSLVVSPEPAAKRSDDEDRPVVEEETRKVPKVTLKFKDFEYQRSEESKEVADEEHADSDDSEKLTMEVDRIEDESLPDENPAGQEEGAPVEKDVAAAEAQTIQVAGPEVPIVELELEQPLDRFEVRLLLEKCLRMTIPTCVYCNHARRISVNGKQLGLHAIAEHRFSAVVNSITAEELIPESFVARIRDGLPDLDNVFFSLDGGGGDSAHLFECFQCRYSTAVHKELYLHNRKMHAKSILLCIMCKSNFYSYSELICHLCPGVYELERDVRFRCCMCVGDELPSAFRLMVHLRKRHNACDVCLEPCHNQAKLSNHVWKHKLHHLCYRCGIAYRNKPDITKHLFWKHGTESVLCKKCLQKKWPHVYHFCILPPSFVCEECNLSFSKAVYLMVHKRLHSDVRPHACSEEGCGERFISKKLLLKHEFKHREPVEEQIREVEKLVPEEQAVADESAVRKTDETGGTPDAESAQRGGEAAPKPVQAKSKVDVYDLPELNLSESDSSDSGDETSGAAAAAPADEECAERPVLETIWDDFRNYRATQEKENPPVNLDAIMGDHDYCVVLEKPTQEVGGGVGGESQPDHDYCFGPKPDADAKDAKSSSDSSSDSDSSSCTCGSNCSCSSSSPNNNSSSSDSSSSDSSSSEGRRRQQARRERRRQRAKARKKVGDADENGPVDVVTTNDGAAISGAPTMPEIPIQESDLETTESDTDEDFYDEQPQKLANRLLAEKKNQLLQMAAIGPYINGSIMDGSRPPTPGTAVPTPAPKKKKSKSKKRKKKSRKYEAPSLVAPLTLPLAQPRPGGVAAEATSETDSSLRASKRRRVPNKFYGYSSDEEAGAAPDRGPQPPALKWRKVDLPAAAPPRSPLVVPPITIKTSEPIFHLERQHATVTAAAATDSNESSSDLEGEERAARPPVATAAQPQLYCYCRCPYDEVSEMIGCDSSDCAIEWFHFECVGIMVPPKGHWFCPDCRKRKQQRRELLHQHI